MPAADPARAVVDLTRRLVAFDSVPPGLVPGVAVAGAVPRFPAGGIS